MKKLFFTILITVFIFSSCIITPFFVFAQDTDEKAENIYQSLSFVADYTTHEEVHVNGIHEDLLDTFQDEYISAFCNPYGTKYVESPLIIDAEKTADTSSMCWATSTANILRYSGWINKIDKNVIDFENDFDTEFYDLSGEDAIFNYFTKNFNNKPSNTALALTWFFNNHYDVPEDQTNVARPQNDLSGGLLPNYLVVFFSWQIEAKSIESLHRLMDYVDAGAGVCLMMNWRNAKTENSGNHVITIWGYTCDTTKNRTDDRYCLSLLYTDSDDNEFEDYSDPTPNRMKKIDIKICTEDDLRKNSLLTENDIGKIYCNNYAEGLTLVSSNILALAPPSVPKDDFTTCVTTKNDVYDFTDGQISLREAVAYAKYTNTTVTFDPTLDGQTFELQKPLTIQHKVNVDASALKNKPTIKVVNSTEKDYGAIQLYDSANVVLNGIKVTSSTKNVLSGIYNNGKLTLRNCVIFDNKSDTGGGIYNNASLVLDDCEIVDNYATNAGGGVYCTANASIMIKGITTIKNNTSGKQVPCNVMISNSNLLLNNLQAGSKIGIYINKCEKNGEVLCNVNENNAQTVISCIDVDNANKYAVLLNEEHTQIQIFKQTNLLGCGTVNFSTSTLLPVLFAVLFLTISFTFLKRKIYA